MGRKPTHIRKEEIINTAMTIINEQGFLAFTTRRLAKKIGVSEPALYRHFKNKDDIIVGIISKMDSLWQEVQKQVSLVDEPTEKLQVFMKIHFSYIENNPDIVAILFADEYIRRNKVVAVHLEKVQMKRFEYLLQLLSDGMNNGDFVKYDPQIMVVIILGAIRAAVLNWVKANHSFSLAPAGDKVIATFLKILTIDKSR